jgi:hypothetical protein
VYTHPWTLVHVHHGQLGGQRTRSHTPYTPLTLVHLCIHTHPWTLVHVHHGQLGGQRTRSHTPHTLVHLCIHTHMDTCPCTPWTARRPMQRTRSHTPYTPHTLVHLCIHTHGHLMTLHFK